MSTASKDGAVTAAPQSRAQVKPGDILICEQYNGSRKSLVYVDRVTKTQIIDTDGGRWSKRTGRRIGDGQYNAWHDYIRVPTPGEVEDVKAEIDRRRLAERISWRLGSMDRVLKFSGAELQQIARIIDEHDSRKDQVAAEAAGGET